MTTEVDAVPRELGTEEEPRYLRRQKPVEVRRRKFGRRNWPNYRRALAIFVGVVATGSLAYAITAFFLWSPRVRLRDSADIELVGNRYVSRPAVLTLFAHDFEASIFAVPLDTRRSRLEAIPWVSRAIVSRIWPNRIRIEVSERMPVAYLRSGSELCLVDDQGVILERPAEADFQFPVVSGLSEAQPVSERAERIAQYSSLMHAMDQTRAGTSDHLSEVDLSDSTDVRATLAGLGQMGITGLEEQGPVLVHFGDGDFGSKFRLFLDNLAQWRAEVGRVESVDLRFAKQVVVNPEARLSASNASSRQR